MRQVMQAMHALARRLAAVVLAVTLVAGATADAAAQVRVSVPARTAQRGWLGVGVDTRFVRAGTGLREPLVITSVEPGSPAARAGLRPGDAVIRVNGQTAVVPVFRALPFTLGAGDTVRLVVRRQDRDRAFTVVAGERPRRYTLRHLTISADTLHRLTVQLVDSVRASLVAAQELAQQARIVRLDSLARVHALGALVLDSAHTIWSPREGRAWFHFPDTAWSHFPDMTSFYFPDTALAYRRVQELRAHPAWVAVARGAPDAVTVLPSARAPDIRGVLLLGQRAVAGAEFTALNAGLAQYFAGAEEGLLTLRVAPATPAARAGLEPGDVVISVERRPVRTVRDLRSALSHGPGASERGEVRLHVIRKGARLVLRLETEPL